MRALAIIVAAFGVLAAPGTALAGAEGPWTPRPHIALRLSAATVDIDGTRQPWAAIEARIDPGWKIYWRTPGDTGLPTVFDWSASRNLAAAEIRWPAPTRSRSWGIDTIGYRDRVVFPAALRWQKDDAPARIEVVVSYGICREICIPDEVRLVLDIAPGMVGPSAVAGLIRAALATVPVTPPPAAARVTRARRQGTMLIVEAEADAVLTAPDLFVDGPVSARFGTPEMTLEAAGHRVRFDIPIAGLAEGRQPLTLTLVDGARAFEWRLAIPYP